MTVRFDWDEGNWPKCGKHGVTKAEIEGLFTKRLVYRSDPFSSEERTRAVGRTADGRHLFVVFTLREGLIRPISARYMHEKEASAYDEAEDVPPAPDR